MTSTSPDPTNYPDPSPEFLTLHATCAKAAHFSGAGAYLDELDEGVEHVGVLAGDGGSADLLPHALMSMSMGSTGARDRVETLHSEAVLIVFSTTITEY